MAIVLTKTDYILWRECKKNVWYKVYKPEVYNTAELSEFEKQIIETGNDVELEARKLFPKGFLVQGRDKEAQEITQDLILQKREVIFQPIFVKGGFLAAVDILVARENPAPQTDADLTQTNADKNVEYDIYEVKSTTSVDKKTHYHDLAFQVNLLEKFGLKVGKAFVIHLNSEYVRRGQININQLFEIEQVSETVNGLKEAMVGEMARALQYLQQEDEPKGYCDCVYKGRSNHCSTFAYSNPKVPAYGVHDISRIGASKSKLQELIDVGIFEMKDVPEDVFNKLTDPQKNQIIAFVQDKILQDRVNIKKELDTFTFPLYFLDYETFPCAIPRFDGFSPYQQIPFQYSLYVLESSEARPRINGVIRGRASDGLDVGLKHFEFLFAEKSDPSLEFVKSLHSHIGETGTIIVWNKKFECKINEEIGVRLPDYKPFIDAVNVRVYDLMDIFGKQFYVHKDFKGKISIKNVLPVLAPELSYNDLEIKEGGTASQKWNEIYEGMVTGEEKQKIITDLKVYCKLDTYAMYAIWKHLYQLVS